MEDPKTRMETLAREIEEHNRRYHTLDAPVISDAAYDALVAELARLEAARPDLAPEASPTRRVGAPPLPEFGRVTHVRPLLSLANTYDAQELREFDDRLRKAAGVDGPIDYVVELKFDGLSVALRYEEGRYVEGATRGDGEAGENVTPNLATLRTVPLRLARPASVAVRGEVYVDRADFAELNRLRAERGEAEFANPRNFAAGSVRQLDSAQTARRRLKIFVYDLLGDPRSLEARPGVPVSRQIELLDALAALGFRVHPDRTLFRGIEPVIEYALAARERAKGAPYDVDGLVVKADSFALRDAAGYTAKAPRWACAFKFPQERARTRLLSVEVNVGKTGILTPVAVMEPVSLGGSVVRRASLHNWDEIEARDLRTGDTVVVEKAGEIIPQVVEFVPELRPADAAPPPRPAACPACGAPAARLEGEVAIRCLSPACPAQIARKIEFFCSKDGVEIEGLGEKLVDQLVSRGLVRDVADLYALTLEGLLTLERMGPTLAEKLLSRLAARKELELSRFLAALNIPHVGRTTAEAIAARFDTLEAVRDARAEELLTVPDVGATIAASIRGFFAAEGTLLLLAKFARLGVRTVKTRAASVEGVAGKSFVITGTLPSMGRAEAIARVTRSGGKAGSAVSKRTDYLVAGENPGSKLEAAKKHGVTVLDEAAFLALLAGAARGEENAPEAGAAADTPAPDPPGEEDPQLSLF